MAYPDVNGALSGYTIFPVEFTKPPGAKIGSNHQVLNDHTYCCQLGGDHAPCATGEPDPDLVSECLAWHHKRSNTRAKDAERLGVPYHITEFGACLAKGPCT